MTGWDEIERHARHHSEVLTTIRRHRLHRLYKPRQQYGQWVALRRGGTRELTAPTEWGILEAIYDDFTGTG